MAKKRKETPEEVLARLSQKIETDTRDEAELQEALRAAELQEFWSIDDLQVALMPVTEIINKKADAEAFAEIMMHETALLQSMECSMQSVQNKIEQIKRDHTTLRHAVYDSIKNSKPVQKLFDDVDGLVNVPTLGLRASILSTVESYFNQAIKTHDDAVVAKVADLVDLEKKYRASIENQKVVVSKATEDYKAALAL